MAVAIHRIERYTAIVVIADLYFLVIESVSPVVFSQLLQSGGTIVAIDA